MTDHIRYNSRVVAADWSNEQARWHVCVEDAESGARRVLTCDLIYGCTGYYRYDEGYTPAFAGISEFGGQVVHPQEWPQDLDYAGKRVVVVGSGATAVTIVPRHGGGGRRT